MAPVGRLASGRRGKPLHRSNSPRAEPPRIRADGTRAMGPPTWPLAWSPVTFRSTRAAGRASGTRAKRSRSERGKAVRVPAARRVTLGAKTRPAARPVEIHSPMQNGQVSVSPVAGAATAHRSTLAWAGTTLSAHASEALSAGRDHGAEAGPLARPRPDARPDPAAPVPQVVAQLGQPAMNFPPVSRRRVAGCRFPDAVAPRAG